MAVTGGFRNSRERLAGQVHSTYGPLSAVTIRLRGFEDITRRLALLRTDVARSFLKGALRRLAEYVADEVRRAAPIGRTTSRFGPTGGTLRRAIGVAARKAYQNSQARMVVGINPDRAFYWKFIEFGTQAHVIKAGKGKFLWWGGASYKSVKHPGISAKPFIRPTWDRIKTKLPKMFADDVSKLLKKHGLN
jgi:HK97 gp10 family phage protein